MTGKDIVPAAPQPGDANDKKKPDPLAASGGIVPPTPGSMGFAAGGIRPPAQVPLPAGNPRPGPRPPMYGSPGYSSNVQNTYFGAASSGIILPLSIGSVVGVRSWDVDAEGNLVGLFWHQIWEQGRNDALCLKHSAAASAGGYVPAIVSTIPGSAMPPVVREQQPDQPHDFEACRCGFYGYFDGSNDYYRAGYVAGVIEAYGEVVIGTRGFRAMKAEIIALCPPRDLPPEKDVLLRQRYAGLPMFDSFDTMVQVFPPTDPTDEATAPEQEAG